MIEKNETNETNGISATIDLITDMEDPADGSILVSAKKNGKGANIYYNFGKTLEEMVDLFGESIVFSQARAQMKIKLQSAMRSYLMTGRNVEELVTKYVPGVVMERMPTDMSVATETYFATLSEEEQDAMIAKLMQSKNGS